MAEQANDGRQWSWWAMRGEDVETYCLNKSTRADVIAAARYEYGDDAIFTIIEATQDGPFDTNLFDEDNVEEVIDRFVEANSGRFGENGWDGHIDHYGLANVLNAALAAYFEVHGDDVVVWTFTGVRNKEVIRPEPSPA